MADIRELSDQIENILDQIKEIDRQQKRRIRRLEGRFDFPLPDLIPGRSGELIADDDKKGKKK